MFAVIETGGKQYRVQKGAVFSCERIPAEVGSSVELPKVLLACEGEGASPVVGTPYLAQAKVVASVLEQKRGEKLVVFKKRRRKGFCRKTGHRQELSVLRVVDIHLG